ncbi:unnamed protein product, partial [Didymodactylos carnosus]
QYILLPYRNALLYVADGNENNYQLPSSNLLGTWDCGNSGKLTFKSILADYESKNLATSALLQLTYELKCQNDQ